MSKKKKISKAQAVKNAKKSKHRFPKAVEEIEPIAVVKVAADEDDGDVFDEEIAAAQENLESDGELNLEFADEEEAIEFNEEELAAQLEMTSESESGAEPSSDEEPSSDDSPELDGTELASFDSANIEDLEVLTSEQIRSIVESVLFSTDKPLSIPVIKQAFKGTNVKSKDIRECLTALVEDYATTNRGFSLNEVGGGFQLRTKPENMKYLRQSVKARPFRLSGPALEVLSIVAYKQPMTKAQIDEIRGVESGHLLRALMEKSIISFGERSDLPGKPMFYETTRRFLEIFGLRNIQELPSLNEIDQLIPEGIGDDVEKETLGDITEQMSTETAASYSIGEDELLKITDELSQITTSSDFFEQEKVRLREKRDADRAQDIREKMIVGEAVDEKDQRWLERYDAAKIEAAQGDKEVDFVTDGILEGETVATEVLIEEPEPERDPALEF